MKTNKASLLLAALLALSGVSSADADLPVDGVISVSPVLDHSCIAVELQVDPGATIAGVRWFHNDASVAFPSLLLMEGEGNTPPDVSQVAMILDQVSGESLAWGEVTLSEPVTTQTGIVYAIFELPAETERTGEGLGGGPGIGYVFAESATPAFMSADALNWVRLSKDLRLQVELVLGGAMRGTGALRSLDDLRETRRSGWWDGLGAEENLTGGSGKAENDAPAVVSAARRLAAVPNPFNPRTAIHFYLTESSKVEVGVYDVRGRMVSQLVSGEYPAGAHAVVWDGTDGGNRSVASGVYYLRMKSAGGAHHLRVTLVR